MSESIGVKVSVRSVDGKKRVIAIVAPKGAAPENTIESLLTTLLAEKETPSVNRSLARIMVIATRNTGNGDRAGLAGLVHESFPVNVRALVRETYESTRHIILNAPRGSIIEESRLAFRIAKRTMVEMVEYVDSERGDAPRPSAPRPSESRPSAPRPRPSESRPSESRPSESRPSESRANAPRPNAPRPSAPRPNAPKRKALSPSDEETEDDEDRAYTCRARVRVCRFSAENKTNEPRAAEWLCYECSTKNGYALMCDECVKVHASWDLTREHVPIRVSDWSGYGH